MSLLDRGRHSVTVELAVKGAPGPYKQPTWTYAPAVWVSCAVQPLSAEESSDLGLQADTAYRVVARDWPGGIKSRVTFDGRVWFQRGETQHYTMSPRTRHDVAIIEAADAEVH